LTVKIETIQATDSTVMRLIGQLEAEYLPELKALIEAAPGGIAFEMDELTLVDVHAVRFLMDCEDHGIELRDCSTYIRKWIVRERKAIK
jgi:hypothetical protein